MRGARENNLRDVDVDLPRDALVVLTGISGSGKSSLAFSTIYAEAQRRYFESVAPYARRLIRQLKAPDVTSIQGLPPAVALSQSRGALNARSTVGTLTDVSSTLRLLYSRAGTYPRGTAERLDADAFSPNTEAGACPACGGQGTVHSVTEKTLVPDPSLTIREGAIAAWPGAWQGKNLRDIVIALGIDVDRPWKKLPRKQKNWLLFTDERPIVLVQPGEDRNEYEYNGKFVSARRHVLDTAVHSTSERMREKALQFVVSVPCLDCGGSRLSPSALAVRFARRSIAEMNALPLGNLAAVLRPTAELKNARAATESVHSGERTDVAVMLARDLLARLGPLLDLGLSHLSLGRAATTISSGELQRLRLATALRSGLFGVVYVLDEPCAGLHPADAEPLYLLLERIRSAGNTLLVVEHVMDLVKRADWICDVGPGAGQHGGKVLYSGPLAGLRKVKQSITRRHLFPTSRRQAIHSPRSPDGWIRLEGIRRHNLDDLCVEFPRGVLTAVTGVSGSGKSTLVTQILAGVVAQKLGRATPGHDEPRDELLETQVAAVRASGVDVFKRLVPIDQKPIGRTPRSNPATYTGLFDRIRRLFSETPSARRRRLGPGHFSFNVAGGRCETCQGAGVVSVELVFLAATYSRCPDCQGARYDERTLEIRLRGKNIAEILAMTVEEATEFFTGDAPIVRSLSALDAVGLGYLCLGQPAPELSGGEAQRLRLATELQRPHSEHTLYILDEPTASLHPEDAARLMVQLHRLVDAGHTVVIVEHDVSMMARADYLIDLGPGGGDRGGRVVAHGPPEKVARSKRSRTAPFLASRL